MSFADGVASASRSSGLSHAPLQILISERGSCLWLGVCSVRNAFSNEKCEDLAKISKHREKNDEKGKNSHWPTYAPLGCSCWSPNPRSGLSTQTQFSPPLPPSSNTPPPPGISVSVKYLQATDLLPLNLQHDTQPRFASRSFLNLFAPSFRLTSSNLHSLTNLRRNTRQSNLPAILSTFRVSEASLRTNPLFIQSFRYYNIINNKNEVDSQHQSFFPCVLACHLGVLCCRRV
jgi:hypothetical protein